MTIDIKSAIPPIGVYKYDDPAEPMPPEMARSILIEGIEASGNYQSLDWGPINAAIARVVGEMRRLQAGDKSP